MKASGVSGSWSPANDTMPTRVVRGSNCWSRLATAATSAARMLSPGSELGSGIRRPKTEAMPRPPLCPTFPSPSMSSPEGVAVLSEVSITKMMSNVL